MTPIMAYSVRRTQPEDLDDLLAALPRLLSVTGTGCDARAPALPPTEYLQKAIAQGTHFTAVDDAGRIVGSVVCTTSGHSDFINLDPADPEEILRAIYNAAHEHFGFLLGQVKEPALRAWLRRFPEVSLLSDRSDEWLVWRAGGRS